MNLHLKALSINNLCLLTWIFLLPVYGGGNDLYLDASEKVAPGNLLHINATPHTVVLSGQRSQQRIAVTATFENGNLRDITDLCTFKSQNSDIANLRDNSVIYPQKNGQTQIKVVFQNHQAHVSVLVSSMEQSITTSFMNEVNPAITKSGCNAGTCHGTPTGKNGFRLSLRGYDPELDFHSLTREMKGRRIDLTTPDNSLLLLKPTMQVTHEGGKRFDRHSSTYGIILDWIQEGLIDDRSQAPKLSYLEILPNKRVLEAPADSQQLVVLAHFENGIRWDVTHLARFTSNDETQAEVSLEGKVSKHMAGEVTVCAEYLSQFASSQLIFLDNKPSFTWTQPPVKNYIDQHVFDKLKLLRIQPSELCSDEVFIRRIFLDVIGLLPSPDEVRDFLADARPNKRRILIHELLERSEFADWWAMKWIDRLGGNQRYTGIAGAPKYHQWVRSCIADNIPEDVFVRSLLTSSGGNYGNPAASFWRRLRIGGLGKNIDASIAVEEITQLFMGVRIQCAKCHNHPAEKWTQDDYYGLSAFFNRIQFKNGPFFGGIYNKEETIFLRREGDVTHPRTGKRMAPKPLGESVVEVPPNADRREVFAEWLTAPENPFFAAASVNRMWYHLFGRGIIEPVDDIRNSNPPSNGPLLDALAKDFVVHNFDRKHLIRTILNSRTYQLSSLTNEHNQDDNKYFSRYQLRMLGAEQLLDAICTATGTTQKFPGFPRGIRAVQLPDGEFGRKRPGETFGTNAKVDPSTALVGNFLVAFGRPSRAIACECERDTNTNLIQALQLVGGDVIQHKIESPGSRVDTLVNASLSDHELLDELFLSALSMFPSSKERNSLLARLAVTNTDNRTIVEDILWALINHDEFLFQH